jgi:pimeloyl-ACP methyl ester carboxylesterase
MVPLLMAEIPSTHYVKSDDVHIAYQVLGQGSFDLLFVPGFVSNIEAIWQSLEQSAFFRRLASFSRLILFDKRGTGMSDRGSQMFALEQRMHDVQAILDEVGSRRTALFGISEGGPMSLLFTATYPDRTSALVLYGSYARRSWAPDYSFGWKDERLQQVLDDIEHNWGTAQSKNMAMRAPAARSHANSHPRRASSALCASRLLQKQLPRVGIAHSQCTCALVRFSQTDRKGPGPHDRSPCPRCLRAQDQRQSSDALAMSSVLLSKIISQRLQCAHHDLLVP